MDLKQYYSSVKMVGVKVNEQDSSILDSLVIIPDDEPPSEWMPRVQKVLLDYYKNNSGTPEAEQSLSLYIQGQIFLDSRKRYAAAITRVVFLVLGVILGWFVWGLQSDPVFNCQACEPDRVFLRDNQK